MRIEITITDDMLKVIPTFRIFKDKLEATEEFLPSTIVTLNSAQLLLGNNIIDNLAWALGIHSEGKVTELGLSFDKETTQRLTSLYDYLSENLYEIEVLLHQYACNGGITAGTYVANDTDMIFTKKGE